MINLIDGKLRNVGVQCVPPLQYKKCYPKVYENPDPDVRSRWEEQRMLSFGRSSSVPSTELKVSHPALSQVATAKIV
jgi:hypothetical protein